MSEINFRDREAARQQSVVAGLLGVPAQELSRDGSSGVLVPESPAGANLHESIRSVARAYFERRRIVGHSERNILSSQALCVNLWFPFSNQPDLLAAVLRALGYDVAEVLPFDLDDPAILDERGLPTSKERMFAEPSAPPCLAFEWIGAKNYLQEGPGGVPGADESRTRGAHSSAVDVAIRFRRTDGELQILLIESKYKEDDAADKRKSKAGTDRVKIYRPAFHEEKCQIALPVGIDVEDLFFDPFDQMMRHQLLASAMEREKEMDADVVSYLHVAPRANEAFHNRITSPKLSGMGERVYEVWDQLVLNDRFHHVYTEDLIAVLLQHAPDPAWADYIAKRYGEMK